MAGRRLLSEGHDHHLPHAPRAVYLRGWKAVLVFGVSLQLRVEGGESIAIVGLSIRMTPVGCSEASLCEDAKRMQRSVVMPGEERKMQSGPHRPPARIKSGGRHAFDGGEQRQETVWRNYSRVCSQRAVAPLPYTRGRENEPPATSAFCPAQFRCADFGLKSENRACAFCADWLDFDRKSRDAHPNQTSLNKTAPPSTRERPAPSVGSRSGIGP